MEPEELQNIGVDEHLGDVLPLKEMVFTSDDGSTGDLTQFFADGKPVVLTLYYSDCPMLCSLVLNGLSKATQNIEFAPGRDYRLLTVSIDPEQTVEQCKAARERFEEELPVGKVSGAWRFFRGDTANINHITNAVGFRYFKVEESGEYAHPAVVMILTPEGKISRYLYGIEFKPADLRMALLEASKGKIGTTVDRILLYCYHYDPSSKGYVILAGQVMKLGGGVTVIILAVLLGMLWIKDARKVAKEGSPE